MTIHPEAPLVPVEQFALERRDDTARALLIRGDTYLGRGARTGVVVCHGFKGFGRWGFYPYLAPHIAAAGLNVVTFDFSGSGVGEDREAYADFDAFARNRYTQELADLQAVVEESRRRGWIGEQYGLFGHSRGGGDAILHAAGDRNVAVLVTWAAIAYVYRWSANTAAEWRERGYAEVVNARTGDVLRLDAAFLEECEQLRDSTLSIERAASRIGVPWLLAHGSADETVAVDDAHRLYAAAGGADSGGVTLHLVPGGNHVFGASHPLGEVPEMLREAVRRTADFFARHVR